MRLVYHKPQNRTNVYHSQQKNNGSRNKKDTLIAEVNNFFGHILLNLPSYSEEQYPHKHP